MNIIGAGLTGCLAAYALKNSVIHEYLETPNAHKAVLRFRNDSVSQLTGIPFKKVTVHKGIFSGGVFCQPDVRIMNRYSKKVTGGYHDRSVANINPSVRYIAPKNFHQLMLNQLGDRINYGCTKSIEDFETPVISTIPLPVLANKLGFTHEVQSGECKSIYVATMKVDTCDVYQTIYFPDADFATYRASITGDTLIIESTHPVSDAEVKGIAIVFGIRNSVIYDTRSDTKQEFGKFIEMPDEPRKKLMYDITQKYGIYSLGRHATWRKILLDDVVQDIHQIERMIKNSAYDLIVGKAK